MLPHHDQRTFAGDAACTHLDPQETPVTPNTAPLIQQTPDPALALSDNFRHSGWQRQRAAIFATMQALYLPWPRLQAFASCGSSAWVMRSTTDPELFRVVPDYCHDRFCVPCGGQRQATIRRNLDVHLGREPHRFLTLTIRHAQEPLETLVHRLYVAFRYLRHRRAWKQRVKGGVAFLEITFNPETRSWNPHLHCMLEGSYFDLQDLSRLWLAATGDSQNVKIKLIRNRPAIINYVTKYATKPLPPSVVSDPDALAEAIQALRSRRMIVTFGTWHRWKLLADPKDEGWTVFAHLNALRLYAIADDVLCENILAMVNSADPRTGEFYVHVETSEPDT